MHICKTVLVVSFDNICYYCLLQFKTKVAEKFEAEPEQLCLIFAGKIMKDNDTLKGHNVKDGLTVHLVIKAQARPEPPQQPSRPAADVRQTPFGLNQLGGLSGLEALGAGSGSFMDMQAHMQHELMSNPEIISTLLDNPMVSIAAMIARSHFSLLIEHEHNAYSDLSQVQEMMNSPDTMNALLQSNPQMRGK